MKSKRKAQLIFFCLSIIFIILCMYTLRNMSYTVSEPIYIMAGYYYLTEGETFYTGHPFLTHIISAIPLLFIDIDKPEPAEIYHPFEFARKEWLYYGNNNADQIIFLARIPFILLSIFFAGFIFRWTRELFGLIPGTVALIFYFFNPDIIWNSVVVMTDLAVAGFMFISCYYLWKYLKEEKRKNLVYTGIFFGAAISSKSTALFIIPIYLGMFLIMRKWIWKKTIKESLYILAIALILFSLMGIGEIAPIYNQENPFYQQFEDARTNERLIKLANEYTNNEIFQEIIIVSLRDVSLPSSSSIQAYVSQFKHTVDGHSQYFNGEYSSHGIWYYYFFEYLVKTPLALIVLFIFSIFLAYKLKTRDYKDEIAIILPIIIFLAITSFIMKLNLGLRHTLLVHFFLIIFIARLFQYQKYKTKIFPIIFSILVGIYILGTVLYAPNYIAYFNELLPAEQAPAFVIDDSIDFGQSLILLGNYVKENNITNIKLRYSGFEHPEYRGITYEKLDCKPTTGILAVSVNALYGGKFWYEGIQQINMDCYAWLREKEPIARVGYTIYVYNITEEDL